MAMTSVIPRSFSRNSVGPDPTTSSDTSLTMRVSSRCGRIAPLTRRRSLAMLALDLA